MSDLLCKAWVLGNKSVFKGSNGYPCARLAKLDGYCMQHHPETIAKREIAALAVVEARKAKVHKHCVATIAAKDARIAELETRVDELLDQLWECQAGADL
jgi:hypothetical protein